LAAGYYSLAATPETEYLLSFVPEKAKLDGKFHKLKVEVNLPSNLSVQARPGYFAPVNEPKPDPANVSSNEATAEEKLDVELSGLEEKSEFPLSVTEGPGAGKDSARTLNVQTRVDIRELPFERQDDRYINVLTLVIALFDAQGNMIAGKEARMQLALKPETFERFSKAGLGGTMTLEAPPGAYRLRVVVEEAMRGKMSATGRSVQIQ